MPHNNTNKAVTARFPLQDYLKLQQEAQPSLDAIKKIAIGLHVSTDFLLFEEHERGPSDDLALQLEAISQMPEGEQMVIREVLESLIIKYQSRRWDSGRQAAKG